ncbi:MAG: type I restriction enzyme HsdR N-terminal domain-containing protein, partial [Bacteroidia bacterium]
MERRKSYLSKVKALNLPPFEFNIRSLGQSKEIFDVFRRKFVALTPEEWVRQHFAVFMSDHLGYPKGLIALEVGLIINGVDNRADI